MNTVISRKIMAAIKTTICLKSLTNSILNQINYVFIIVGMVGFHYSRHVLHTHAGYAFPLNSTYLFSLTPIRLTTNDLILGVHFYPSGHDNKILSLNINVI